MPNRRPGFRVSAMPSPRANRLRRTIALFAATAFLVPASLRAQASALQRAAGVLAGDVVDADNAQPLARSTVVLRLLDEGAMVASGEALPTILATGRQTVTDSDGRYRFTGLADGRYQLHVQRLGYRAATIEVELRSAGGTQVSVGLVVVPVRLTPLPASAEGPIAFGADAPSSEEREAGDPRVRAARARQHRFAGTDVRELTEPEVLESGSLGETDLFRALQRLPGVTTYGDYTAELWTRGGAWDATRVYFDGVPVFSPMHVAPDAGGTTITGIAPDLVGSALLFPGVRPASIAEGSAAVLDLRSRPAVPDGDLRGIAELTLLSGRLALSRGARDGTSGWSVVGRHAASDLFRGSPLTGGTKGDRRYFDDVAARWERALGRGARIEASGVFVRDYDRVVSAPYSVYRADDRSRSAGGQVAFVAQPFGLRVRQSIGASAYDGALDASSRLGDPTSSLVRGDTVRSHLAWWSLAGEVEPQARPGAAAWRGGYALTGQRLDNAGYLREQRNDDVIETRLERAPSLSVASLWGEGRWRATRWLGVETGLRVDAGRGAWRGPTVRPMPRLQLRATVDSATTVSLGAGRSWQYTQAMPRGIQFNGMSAHGAVWRLPDAGTPAQRTDVVTFGAERWLDGAWLVGANAYARRTTGVLLADPRTNPIWATVEPAAGEQTSRGVELGLRRLAGRTTGTLGLTLASTRAVVAGARFPADQDRPVALDATLLYRWTRRLKVGGTYTWMSGRPYTAYSIYLHRDSTGSIVGRDVQADAPNARRGRRYESLDLLLDWSGTLWGARTGAFLQLRNVLYRQPSIEQQILTYTPTSCAPSPAGAECVHYDSYGESRVGPFTPMIGIRIAF